jgi:probable HAF family extracellular repeat protein
MFAVVALVFSLLLSTLAAAEAPGPSFQGVGVGGSFTSKAYGVSANGRFVVGVTGVELPGLDTREAFRWEGGVLEDLGWLTQIRISCVSNPCGPDEYDMTNMSEAFAVSPDGSVVGRVCKTDWWEPDHCAAARFAGSSPIAIQPGVHLLGDGAVWTDGRATDITADGATIYGTYHLMLEGLDEYDGIFRWQDPVASVLDAGVWLGADSVKVSPDGGAYAYTYRSWLDYLRHVALHRLGGGTDLGPGFVGDISKLGLVVVGQSSSQAARWQGGEVALLGDLPGGAEESWALAVSDAGHVIAGWGTSDAGHEAFLWTPETGMRRLADVLTEHGLDVSDWTLREATGLSASGRTVVGWGISPSGYVEGFVATLPARAIPAPSLGPFGLALLVVFFITAAGVLLRRGQGRPRDATNTCSGSFAPR